ncbi:MAG: hypothetical protein ACP5I4_03720 [Oceanipulchritudo sp.]
MHRLILCLALLLLPVLQPAAGVLIQSAHSRFYEEGEIRPVSQYFGSSLAEQRFRTVIPSDPENPSGQYFILRLEREGGPEPALARISLFSSNSKDMRRHEWSLAGKPLKGWLYLGLTGVDWSSGEVSPMAWRIELLDTEGTLLAEWKSFLWEMP